MGRVAFLFAGQGAQVPGMASDVKDLPKVRKLFSAAEAIRPGIVDKMLNGTQEELNRTLLTQPVGMVALCHKYNFGMVLQTGERLVVQPHVGNEKEL